MQGVGAIVVFDESARSDGVSRRTVLRLGAAGGAGVALAVAQGLGRPYLASRGLMSPSGREFVALRNSGTIVTQLEGWRLRDRSGRTLTLPQLALAPGASVRVYTGSGRQTQHRVFLGRAADIWGPSHDTVRLSDARGAPIATRRY